MLDSELQFDFLDVNEQILLGYSCVNAGLPTWQLNQNQVDQMCGLGV
jgi:hypothetical protein